MKHSAIEIGTQLEAAAPQLRTVETMLQDMESNVAPNARAVAQGKSKPFLPTMPAAEYEELKSKLRAQDRMADKPVEAGMEAEAKPKPKPKPSPARPSSSSVRISRVRPTSTA